MHAIGLGPELQEKFLEPALRCAPERELLLLDPPTCPHPPLERGQRFLIRGLYREARREFEAVFKSAAAVRDYALQADAAARMGWLYFELDQAGESLRWLESSVEVIETYLGERLIEIIASLQPGSHSALCAENHSISHVLSRTLHIRSKVLAGRVIYHNEWERRAKADMYFSHSLTLDRYLKVPAQIGHDLRWQAALITSGPAPRRQEAENLLSESREKFARGSIGEAYLNRDRGIVCWQTDRLAVGRRFLLEALDGLSSFGDSRALGPACYVLSRSILQGGGDAREARRYALAGATLTPYGLVLSSCKEQFQHVTQQGIQRDIDDLRAGKKPFEMVHPVMMRLSDGSARDATEVIERNLTRVFDSCSQFALGDRHAE
jgi:tetratricopeptide (TPR) repeat protein